LVRAWRLVVVGIAISHHFQGRTAEHRRHQPCAGEFLAGPGDIVAELTAAKPAWSCCD
jgi:hypothetical protein